MPFFTFFSRSFRIGLVASLYYLFLVLAVPAQAKVAFYLIEDTEDPSPSLAACMAVYTSGVLIEPERIYGFSIMRFGKYFMNRKCYSVINMA